MSSSFYSCSLKQLSTDIHNFSKDYDIGSYRLAVIKQQILSGNYVLSPFEVSVIKKVDISDFLREKGSFGMYGTRVYPDSEMITVDIPYDEEDVLVLKALSQLLLRLSHGRRDICQLSCLDSPFYCSLQEMGKVDRLYKIDLEASLSKIPISLVLDKVRALVSDSSVYKLISSFLSDPIRLTIASPWSSIAIVTARQRFHIFVDDEIRCRGIPPLGEIKKVLFHIVLMDIFDLSFPKRFPGIAFSRLVSEVYISINPNIQYNSSFDEKAGYALLEEIGLAGRLSLLDKILIPFSVILKRQSFLTQMVRFKCTNQHI